MFGELLAVSGGWVLDLIFFVFLFLGTFLGCRRGFIAGVCKLAGKVASIIFAITFCISFSNFLEVCFHMTTGIASGLTSAISGNDALAVELPAFSGETLSATLTESGVTGISHWFIVAFFRGVSEMPAGVTPASMIASILAKWISIVISFVLLIILVRLGARLLGKCIKSITDRVMPLRVLDQVLGALLGLVKAFVILFAVLLICNWLPWDAFHSYLESSAVVGGIFRSEWFQSATSYAVSGRWFLDFIN